MSVIRIVHTADNHLGLRFQTRGYSETVRLQLVEERFAALQRIVELANTRHAHFLVVAGDLFDRLDVPRKDIERAASILNGFTGIHLVVLPGNHDFYDAERSRLWETFTGAVDEHRLLLLTRAVPVSVPVDDREVIFYPGPCTSKTSSQHAIAWVGAVPKQAEYVHVGVAHGSVTGISPDTEDRYYQMTPEELRAGGVDFWLLGHTHLRYPSGARGKGSLFFIPSTHTPDGFDCDHEGYVWYLEVDQSKAVTAESVRTGIYRFVTLDRDVRSLEALDALERELESLDPSRVFLKLILRGRLPAEGKERLSALVKGVGLRFAHAEVVDDVILNIDRQYIDRTFAEGSLPHQLLTSLTQRPDDDLALQLAWDLIREARQ